MKILRKNRGRGGVRHQAYVPNGTAAPSNLSPRLTLAQLLYHLSMPSRDRLRPWLTLPLVALLAILPLRHGCSCGHDLDFHLLSWQEAATQFAHGNLHPRWAFTPAFGAGEPRFVFYPPLSWTLGALLTLLVQHLHPLLAALSPTQLHDPAQAFALVPIAYTWICLAAAGLAMHHLARRFLLPGPALLVASLYLVNPYTLFTAYERTAYAELLAAAWLPLLLAGLLPSDLLTPLPVLATAIPLGLLWLTNAPAAVIGSYALAAIVLLRILLLLRDPATRIRIASLLLRAIAATSLGLSLAAFYILPAVLERPWVQIALAITPGLRPQDNTLFHHTPDPDHDAVLHTASVLAVLLLVITALALLPSLAHLRRRRPPPSAETQLGSHSLPPTRILVILAALTLLITFLLTRPSLPLWHHLPQLAFLQFPWRLLALLAPLAALAVGFAIPRRILPGLAALALAILIPAALILPAWHAFHQECDPDDTPQARFALFHSTTGDDPTDEYTPTTADNEALHHNDPPFRLLPLSVSDDTPPPASAQPGAAPLTLQLHLATPELLILNLRAYPTWVVLLNHHLDPDRAPRTDGLLAIPLPPGDDTIQLRQRIPPLEIGADGLSLLSLFGVALFLMRRRGESKTSR